MATLRHSRTNRVHVLAGRTLVGRGPACALRLTESHVSGEHATLIWIGNRWEVRDLGSRNGTFIDGRRLVAGDSGVATVGARVAFGNTDDPWEVVEIGAPSALAEDARTGAIRIAQDGILALPDEEHPEVLVVADGTGRWMIEQPDRGARPIQGEESVTAGGVLWRIRVPEAQAGTAAVTVGMSLDAVKLRFAVSRDEEHVQLSVVARSGEIALEEREHWYTLLTLARRRIEDAAEPPSEQGWIERDDLLRMLGTDSNGLNVAIYRARRQLQAAGVDGAAALVEVRRGQRRIGVAPDRLEITAL